MTIKILFFGSFAEKAGKTFTMMNDLKDVDELKLKLSGEYSFVGKMPYLIAVNHEVVKGNCTLKDGDEVAVMPPFAGG